MPAFPIVDRLLGHVDRERGPPLRPPKFFAHKCKAFGKALYGIPSPGLRLRVWGLTGHYLKSSWPTHMGGPLVCSRPPISQKAAPMSHHEAGLSLTDEQRAAVLAVARAMACEAGKLHQRDPVAEALAESATRYRELARPPREDQPPRQSSVA